MSKNIENLDKAREAKKAKEKPQQAISKPLRYDPDKPNGGYSNSQLYEQIRGNQVSQEFGLPCETLSNWRIHSRQTGKLYGLPFFADGDVNLYWRYKVVKYLQTHSHGFFNKSSDSSDSSDSTDQK